MLRTASLLPLHRAFDTGLRPRPFPDEAASLLPGHLAATRTGLPPASDDELTNHQQIRYVTELPPVLLGARKTEASRQTVRSLDGHRNMTALGSTSAMRSGDADQAIQQSGLLTGWPIAGQPRTELVEDPHKAAVAARTAARRRHSFDSLLAN